MAERSQIVFTIVGIPNDVREVILMGHGKKGVQALMLAVAMLSSVDWK